MTRDFDELVGDGGEHDLDDLRAVHDLLVSVNPPPSLAAPPRPASARRRGGVVAAAAAAALAAAAAAGYTAGHRGTFEAAFSRSMHGVGRAAAARATIEVGPERDDNRPLRVSISSLPAAPSDGRYELILTNHGKPVLLCGTFGADAGGDVHVTMNAPADLGEYDGWIVTLKVDGSRPRTLLTT